MGLFDQIIILIAGKRVAILGPQAAGKTSLHQFLRDGTIPGGDYRPTLGSRRVPAARPSLRDDGLRRKVAIRRGSDVPGDSESNSDDWARLVRESDMVLYLFDGRQVLAGDREAVSRLSSDTEFVSSMLFRRQQERPGLGPGVVLGGSKLDLASEWGQRGYGLPYFQSALSKLPAVRRARLTIGKHSLRQPQLIVGSLTDDPERFAFNLVEAALDP